MSHYQENGDPDFPSANETQSHTFECDADGCTSSDTGDGSFGEVWSHLKSQGWRARTDGAGNWCHYCPDHA